MIAPSADAVAEVELVRVHLPLVTPFRSAHGVEEIRDLILVRVELADGTTGWGECSALARPTYTAEHTDGAWNLLRDELVPGLLAGREPDVVGHPMAVAAIRGACTDASLRRRGRRLVEDLGTVHGRPASRVRPGVVIGRTDTTEQLVEMVAARLAEGAALVKLKVTPHPDDLDAVRTIRATWPGIPLAVDGNGSLDRRSLALLDGLDLTYIEQPCPADALVESAAMARRLDTPVALDESITSMGTLETALTLGAGQVINLKPARVGGVRPAADLARTAVDAGCGVFVGGMLESGVGRAVALALAALPVCTLPSDVGPSTRYVADDVTAPIVADQEGYVTIPTGPGTGVAPRPDRLDDVAVDRLIVRP